MHKAIRTVVTEGMQIWPTKNKDSGGALEVTGVLLEVADPRSRLSRTETRGRIFSALGELCWYLAGSKSSDFISYYIPAYRHLAEDGAIFGGYGPRLFDWKGVNQIARVIKVLSSKPDSRQAVVQLFDAVDISEKHEDVPCTCTLQFMLRQGKLHLLTNMRSNDIHWGLPHDFFCFTMIQEIVARSITTGAEPIEPGVYKHAVGSLHLYAKNSAPARRFLDEGWQPTTPTMPPGDPWPSIAVLLNAEAAIRDGRTIDENEVRSVHDYWADLIRLLQVFGVYKQRRDPAEISSIRAEMSSSSYFPYLDRIARKLDVSRPSGPAK